jgi:hypothetical protein
MRVILAALSLAALSACSSAVPDSGAPADAPLGATPAYRGFDGAGARASAESGVETSALPPDGNAPLPATTASEQAPATPGVVSYALSTTNAVGQKLYRRSIFALPALAARNCAEYPSDDAAQEAFLAAGGPERDRLNLDPDGDGFACNWDPAPYRRLAARSGG